VQMTRTSGLFVGCFIRLLNFRGALLGLRFRHFGPRRQRRRRRTFGRRSLGRRGAFGWNHCADCGCCGGRRHGGEPVLLWVVFLLDIFSIGGREPPLTFLRSLVNYLNSARPARDRNERVICQVELRSSSNRKTSAVHG
jgi:hypothetical protein